MTVTRRDPSRRTSGSAVRWWMRWALLVATLAGLVVMHQLAGGPDAEATAHAGAMAVAEAGDGHCSTPGDGCPDDEHPGGSGNVSRDHQREHDRNDPRHGHAGQVCQFIPPTGGPVPVPALVVTPGAVATAPPVISPRTAAAQAANGSGCGPPSLPQLSVFRI
ncbi:DUF6153 family protein [Micromonospora sp. NPDC003197]